eukprot:scaffold96983_cov13-Tisochrysis_lutea.AAC.1
MLREWTVEKQVTNWKHTKDYLLCLVTTMSANPSGCRGTCVWICLNVSCRMSADLNLGLELTL